MSINLKNFSKRTLASALELCDKVNDKAFNTAMKHWAKGKDKREPWTALIHDVETIREEVAPKMTTNDKKNRVIPVVPTPVPVITPETAVWKLLKAVWAFLWRN